MSGNRGVRSGGGKGWVMVIFQMTMIRLVTIAAMNLAANLAVVVVAVTQVEAVVMMVRGGEIGRIIVTGRRGRVARAGRRRTAGQVENQEEQD